MLGSRMDLALYLVILVLFASFCTIHVWLCAAILRRSAFQAFLALVLLPLAPYFGLSLGLRRAPTAWIVSGSLYALCLVLALVLPETF